MSKSDIKVGMRFGYLTVIAPKQLGKKRESWVCECDCGKVLVKPRTHLLGNKSRRPDKSCGCKEKTQNGETQKNTRIYTIWQLMNRRCYNETADNYERYGGKGVTVCDEWRNNFQSFLQWSFDNGYKDKLTIDRIDSTKPYQPDNCRWVDYYVQNKNKGVSKRNKTGIKGVCEYKYGYRAYISNNGKRYYLGTFKTLEEAKKARQKAEEKYWKANS